MGYIGPLVGVVVGVVFVVVWGFDVGSCLAYQKPQHLPQQMWAERCHDSC